MPVSNAWKNCGFGLLCVATVVATPAQTFTTLADFNGTNGAKPAAGSLVQGTDGNLYGTTSGGGAHNKGTVFKISLGGGGITTLHSFDSAGGAHPVGGLVLATDANFYGTTKIGGTGCGTIFRITATGALTTLHAFNGADGCAPVAGLVQASDGNLYGTTQQGGASGVYGTIFKVTTNGALTTLHSFNQSDGAGPSGPLIQANDGNFYGTTAYGGSTDNYGTIFTITAAGVLTKLYVFGPDSPSKYAALVQGANGNFFGTTAGDGRFGRGTIYSITSGGTLTTLRNFHEIDGADPESGLLEATDQNFYGTAKLGGANNYGTVFKFSAEGTLTALYSFDSTDGAYPYAGLIQGTDGNLYGTTHDGGASGLGTVFRLSVGLAPFMKTMPVSTNWDQQ